ncbi:DEAD/DEAH box helicase [Rubeoparvulum massiliense]|uniref:DEAD/DEAH box helicase n=1 Tax=Rubeoparvulum massiliense TaxID=1631346 RepID=UPI000AE362EF|nr:DEAD/DEAH box helicase [Rubeoparvulum massiliense]
MKTFAEFNVSDAVLKALAAMGFEEPSPIQVQAIPLALAGGDIIGQAQTGTGKTAAFGVPLIEKVELDEAVQGLVLTPTRELAVQVAQELNRIGQMKRIRTLPVYGGQEITRQIKALKNRPQIIVATPGRLLDHIRRRTIRLGQIRMVVLDEADEMLNMGFIEDIEAILAEITIPHQTMLFSATMPKRIQTLAEKFMIDPELVKVKAKELTVTNIEQHYIEVQEKKKFDVLCNHLDLESPDLAIIFGRTKKRVDELVEGLLQRGYIAEGIHGDIPQSKREQVIRRFKDQSIDLMVATDVAARGLDISGVSHVYNFDIPQDPESYVHRIGRTGRAGKKGVAITFVTPREMDQLKLIERITKSTIIRKPIPSYSDVLAGNQRSAIQQLMKVVETGEYHLYKTQAENLLDEADVDSVTIVAAALKLLTKETSTTPVTLSDVTPITLKKQQGQKEYRPQGRGKDGGKGRGNKGRGHYGKDHERNGQGKEKGKYRGKDSNKRRER